MELGTILKHVDAGTARAFVTAARHVIDALMIEAARVRQARTPGVTDYASAGLSREAPGGGWIADEELRGVTQRMSEAIAAEKWVEGVAFAVQAIALLGGA